jgi:hypothetical protein
MTSRWQNGSDRAPFVTFEKGRETGAVSNTRGTSWISASITNVVRLQYLGRPHLEGAAGHPRILQS